jgi:hypothetical protein
VRGLESGATIDGCARPSKWRATAARVSTPVPKPACTRCSRWLTCCVTPRVGARVRDAQVQIARVDATGVHIDEPIVLQGEWDHQRFQEGSAKAGDGGW